jgi:flagellar hook-associated protein 1
MSDLMNIGSSALRTYKAALATVSENVSNAETEGYTRRDIMIKEAPSSGSMTYLYRQRYGFNGSNPGDIRRNVDQFRVDSSRAASSDAGRAEARVRWLSDIENDLNDDANGIGARLTGVYTAVDQLAAEPDNKQLRTNFLSAVDAAAVAFRETGAALATTADNMHEHSIDLLSKTNADIEALAKVNVELRRAGNGTAAHAQLADDRDRILDRLSTTVAIDVKEGEFGDVTVKIAGGGPTLVEYNQTQQIGLTRALDGRLSFTANGTPFAAQMGELAGISEVSNQLADRRAALDLLAEDVATSFNNWHGAGYDTAALATFEAINAVPPPVPLPVQTFGQPLFSTGTGARGLTALISDTDQVAAINNPVPAVYDVNGNLMAPTTYEANGNLLALQGVRDSSGLEQRWGDMVNGNAQNVFAATAENDVTIARKDAAFQMRDKVSGVDLDREAADLIRYQQAYNASAQIIKTAREMIDTILAIV